MPHPVTFEHRSKKTMIKLNSAELLFDKQKVYAKTSSVNKTKLSANNQPGTLAVLLYKAEGDSLPAPQQEMLEKMMAACKFKPEEVQYVNLQQDEITLGDVLAMNGLRLVLIFGKYEGSRNMTALKLNVPVALSGVEVLLTDSLEKLAAEPKLKGNLWTALKGALGL